MNKKITLLQQVFVDQLRDLYSAETQILKALPAMQKAAGAPELKKGFARHQQQTKEHAARLVKICAQLGVKPTGKKCWATRGLIAEAQEALAQNAIPELKDLMIIGAARRVENYEIAAYTGICAIAQGLGNGSALKLLAETLSEEVSTDASLSQMTPRTIEKSLTQEQPGEEEK